MVSSSTSVAPSDLEHWLDGVAASDANLSQHISERQVVGVTGLPSVEANRSLQEGLLWLAAHSPQQPTLKVSLAEHPHSTLAHQSNSDISTCHHLCGEPDLMWHHCLPALIQDLLVEL